MLVETEGMTLVLYVQNNTNDVLVNSSSPDLTFHTCTFGRILLFIFNNFTFI